ncbi:MAG: hypothetical protein ACOCRO_03340 [Halanaerobiales bacterium]
MGTCSIVDHSEVCSCHREAHYGKEKEALKKDLLKTIDEKESKYK